MREDLDEIFSKKERFFKEIIETNCIFVKALKNWVGINQIAKLKLKKDAIKITPKLLINRSRSKTSRCRVCGLVIEKDTLRIGYPAKDPRGNYGYISCWVHLNCSKKILYALLYVEENEEYLKAYLNNTEKIVSENSCNGYEQYIYENIKWELFFGEFEELNEEEREKLKEIAKPYELKNGKGRNSFEVLINEEKEMFNSNDYVTPKNRNNRVIENNFIIPEELKFDLLEYQKEGVSWMISQEHSSIKGGILADEMGMGKTIQAITLILCQKINQLKGEIIKKEERDSKSEWSDALEKECKTDRKENIAVVRTNCAEEQCVKVKEEPEDSVIVIDAERDSSFERKDQAERDSKGGAERKVKGEVKGEGGGRRRGGKVRGKGLGKSGNASEGKLQGQTLIIAPIAAVMQWKSEIEKFIQGDILKVYVYHGSTKKISYEELLNCDVVITSYAMVEVHFRKIINKHKVSCEYCGRLYLPATLVIHKKYFCGPNAIRTEKLKKRKKKNKDTALVAMKKFDDTFVPTPRNVLLEIMSDNKKSNKNDDNGKKKPGKKKQNYTKEEKNSNIVDDKEVIVLSSGESKDSSSSSSSKSFYAPLSRKTASRVIDLCNLGFEKEAIERSVDNVHKSKGTKTGSKKPKSDRNVKWNSVIRDILQNDLYNIDMNDKCKNVLSEIYLSDREMQHEELKKLNMGELKVLLITMGKHVFGTKVELINRVLVSAKYIRQELKEKKKGERNEVMEKNCTRRTRLSRSSSTPSSVNYQKVWSEEEKSGSHSSDKMKEVKILKKMTNKGKRNYAKRKTTNGVCTSKNGPAAKGKEKRRNTFTTGIKESRKRRKRYNHGGNDGNEGRNKGSCDDSDDDSDESFRIEHLKGQEDDERSFGMESGEEDSTEESDLSNDSYDSVTVKKMLAKKKGCKKKEDNILDESSLHNIEWNRIILDEAHRIKNRTTSTTQSIFNLKCSGYRWCLSGTPLQNRIGELYSLIRFLEFYPYAYYFCSKKDCKCLLLNYEMKDNKYCYICNHSRINHFNYFNKRILKPIQSFGYNGEGVTSMFYLKSEILDKILLRRTKGERKNDIKLKPLLITIRKDKLSNEEKDFYESLYKQTSTQFDTYVKSNTVLHNYAHIFDLLSRLRQAADHPYLILFGNSFLSDPSGKFIKKNSSIIPAISNDYVCGICLENIPKKSNITTKCNHNFHKTCLKQYIESFETEHTSAALYSTDKMENLGKAKTYHFGTTTEESATSSSDRNIGGNGLYHTDRSGSSGILSIDRNGVPCNDRNGVPCNDRNGVPCNDRNGAPCNDRNRNHEIIFSNNDSGEKLNRKANSLSVVKFKDREKSKFVCLLNNEENVKDYPLGCPVCYVPMTVDFNFFTETDENDDEEIIVCKEETTYINKSFINRINTQEYQTSTKIEAVFEEVQNVITNTDDKCLIFSQYCSMLDLIEYHLKKHNIICSKLLGYMSMVSRNNILYNFNEDKQLRVLLISLKAGGEGLNLQVANRIFIVDPWWNPAAELQAIQRAHRIGQTKTVYATRFIIENTVEEKIIQLQNRKQLVFDCTIGDSGNAMQKLTKEDLAFLFHA
ncbi:DNA repair protein rhp16, putative [Plasmodium ovale curtisi]|uniref:DNA repair protein rhp16, putative n=1 Tax=Plasmodium ovale curtisi TaxID=864141 RepID=A0A1A8X4K6_PLAOA|nr:DNA repair protein rhp16, putative [Plasmodium ovale curtisi]